MKKILAWLLMAATVLSLCGCGTASEQPEATTAPAETVAEETVAAETQAPVVEAVEAEAHLFLKVSAITFSVVAPLLIPRAIARVNHVLATPVPP